MSAPTTTRTLVTAKQMADLLGVSEQYLRKRTRQATIPSVNLRAGTAGRAAWRYDPVRVIDHLERQTRPW